ncbi:MAG TPA: hypothetical protein PLK12_10475, partial [Prolixibacteraceae bacterium]|nr:hypothetical protein [Prolixibacteraceae bacterium]
MKAIIIFTRMKTLFKHGVSVALGMVSLLALTASQPTTTGNNKMEVLMQKLSGAHRAFPPEIVYLHLDRPSYWASDDIWFKAYLDSPSDSVNLWVELINPAGKILQKKLYLTIDHIAYGDLHLPDTTSSGVYQIRAYTDPMRRSGEEAFFRQNLLIWNLNDKPGEKDETDRERLKIDLQFFPEGGTFLANAQNKLGFKAIDENGIGIDIEGTILDNLGQFASFFRSQHKGMGSVVLIPEEGKSYTAIADINGRTMKVALPKPVSRGIALAVDPTLPDQLRITITEQSAPDSTSENRYYLIGQMRGNALFAKELSISNGRHGLKINKKKLPTGVLQITLFDADLLPLCERLAFINQKDWVELDIQTDKKTYTLREEVRVDLASFVGDSLPVISNLSLSAYATTQQLRFEDDPNNILTHFLLVSDLRGRIEEPAWYFRNQDAETLKALDNLMLTQGWRR